MYQKKRWIGERLLKYKNEEIYEAGFEQGYRAASMDLSRTEPRNQTAFVVGVIAGLFGIWGLSHVLNGKLGFGCLWMLIVGPTLGGLLGGIVAATAGIGAVIALPLWLWIVYVQAKNGASNN